MIVISLEAPFSTALRTFRNPLVASQPLLQTSSESDPSLLSTIPISNNNTSTLLKFVHTTALNKMVSPEFEACDIGGTWFLLGRSALATECRRGHKDAATLHCEMASAVPYGDYKEHS